MARNLRKFTNPKFLQTVDLGQLRRLFERQGAKSRGIDFAKLEGNEAAVRKAVQDFFEGPDESYPPGLVADLHRIAELGNKHGLSILLNQAARRRVVLAKGEKPELWDPKHVALLAFLEQPSVFDAASDLMALEARASLAEFAGVEEGAEPVLDEASKKRFEEASKGMFEEDFRGGYCRVGWYGDDDETNIVVTHGAPVTTAPVIEGEAERVISFRAAEHAVLAYAALTGRLKIGGIAKARQADLANMFARTMLEKPNFFSGAGCQKLYTLEPLEKMTAGFEIDHRFDPGIQHVKIIEVQIDRITTDPKTGDALALWSHAVRDTGSSALGRLHENLRKISFGPNAFRIGHVVLRIQFAVERGRPAKVTVKIKPPGTATFKRHQFEGRIMDLLYRNGLCCERNPGAAAAAAE